MIVLSPSDSNELAAEFAQLIEEILKKRNYFDVFEFSSSAISMKLNDSMELPCSVHKASAGIYHKVALFQMKLNSKRLDL